MLNNAGIRSDAFLSGDTRPVCAKSELRARDEAGEEGCRSGLFRLGLFLLPMRRKFGPLGDRIEKMEKSISLAFGLMWPEPRVCGLRSSVWL
jgi:hypothetical protein